MSDEKQLTLYTFKRGTNGWKVRFVLEELGLTYEAVHLSYQTGECKAPEYTKLNPNGRIPIIIDHGNNNFVLWESNAIIQYLVDKYDTERKISLPAGDDQKYVELQWLYFQASGQGPYYGQAGWFIYQHHEHVPSAIERYRKEILRVLGVLESVLSKQEWLVGGRPTIADICFAPWNIAATTKCFEHLDIHKEFPATAAWHHRIMQRPAIKKAWEEITSTIKLLEQS